MSDMVNLMYLLGKTDALLRPIATSVFNGTDVVIYQKTYIEELLTIRARLMANYTEVPSRKIR
jgi:hypothetical protein